MATEILDTDEVEEIYRNFAAQRPVLVVISGPSGVGKDATLALMKRREEHLYIVVPATTRTRPPGEEEGVGYHFVSVGGFAEMIEQGELRGEAVVNGGV